MASPPLLGPDGRPLGRAASRLTASAAASDAAFRPFRGGAGGASGFEATRANRRLANWPGSSQSLNSLLSGGGDRLRRRALDSARNNPYVASACASFVAHLVGTGIKPSTLLEDRGKREELNRLWLDWTDESDADGLTDFYGQQALAARGLFNAGEAFARLRPRYPEDGLVVPLQVQLLGAAMLPLELNRTEPNGDETRCGIRFSRGRPGAPPDSRVSYFFHRNHPGDFTRRSLGTEFTEVPASEILHLFQPVEEGQIRGVPWSTASLVRLYLLDQFDDALLAKMLTTALFGVAITRPPDPDEGGGPLGDAADDPSGDDPVLTLSSGMTWELGPGEDVKVIDPGEAGDSYEPFQYRSLTAASAGMGVSYSNTTGDYSKSNYSSERAGQVEHRGRIEQLQWSCLVFQFCRRVRQRWLDSAVLAGAVDLPGYARRRREYQRTKWIMPRREWVDLLKDRQAEALAVDQGWKSRSDVIEAEGFDPEEVDARIAQDQERERRLGIVIPRTAAAEARAAKPATVEEDEERVRREREAA